MQFYRLHKRFWNFNTVGPVKLILLAVCISTLFSACTTPEKISPAEVKNHYANLTPAQAMEQTRSRFTEAANEQYKYYSPQNWKLANQAFTEANELAKQDANNQEIFKKLFLVDRRIDSAKYIKDRELKEFADLFEHERILQANNAHTTFKAEYTEETKKLSRLLHDYESVTLGFNKEVENIRTVNIDANKILHSMRALNIKAVKHNYLSNDIKRMQALEKRDAKNIAPVSFAQAEVALKQANDFIEQNVHNKEGVKDIADKFIFSVSHLAHVLDEIITLSKTDIKKLEKVILDQEEYLLKIGKALDGSDVRNLPLATQATSIVKTASNVLDYHAEKSNMIVELTEKNLVLENRLKTMPKVDESANAKLKGKIKLLEMDIQALEKEREKLKEDLFALQQKNIDLAIQNAKLISTLEEGKQGNFKSTDQNSLSEKRQQNIKANTGINNSKQSRFIRSADRDQANLQK